MIRRLIQFSIRFRGVIVALACVLTGYGIYAVVNAKYDVYPEFAPPEVVVQTEAPGLSPEQVEALVTQPVENVLNGVAGLESLRSQSIQGLSVITAVFVEDTDVYRARQMVGERLTEVSGELPQGVSAPVMAPLTSAASMVLAIGLTSDTKSLMDIRTFADWVLRPRLLGVPGVAKAVIFGGDVRQLQIQVLPEKLAAYDLTLTDVLNAARQSTGVRGAGFVENDAQRITLQTSGQANTAGQLGQTVVTEHNGTTVRLGDVARVADGAAPAIGAAAINGKTGVMIMVSSQYGANTLEVTAALDQAIAEMRPAVQAEGIVLNDHLFRPANFIQTSVHNITQSLMLGAALVAIVLFIFLYNLRTALISLTAIPLSLLIAVAALGYMGISLNTLTLGGLAIAIGEVVDDAIIDVENIYRRMRENAALGHPKTAFRVVLDASLEVRGAVVYATFIVAMVFIPVRSMSGVQGRLFAPLAVAYILAIMASLVVALTLTPAMSALLLKKTVSEEEPRMIRWLKSSYSSLMRELTEHSTGVIIAAAVVCVGAFCAVPFFGGEFLPDLKEGHFIIHFSAVPGTSVHETVRIGDALSAELRRMPFVDNVMQQVGRAEAADDTWGVNYEEMHVELKPLEGNAAEDAEARIRAALNKFPGVYFAVRRFLAERIEETISGVTAEVVVKIHGSDLDVLDQKAKEVAAVLRSVKGADSVQQESPPAGPELTIQLRPDRLVQFGFRPVEVMEAVGTAYQGTTVAQTYEGNRVFDVAVILDENMRRDPSAVGSLMLTSSSGQRVRLDQLAYVYEGSGRALIAHEGTRRLQTVTCDVNGRDLTSFVDEARAAVNSKVKFPEGTYAVFTGATEARAQAQHQILLYSLVAVAGIILLLAIVFRRFSHMMLVLANLPFALVGGVLAVFATGGLLTVGSMVGFVTLFGITMRNSMMMISHFEHLVNHEGLIWNRDAAIRGASERLIPILMTAIVTALGLLPLAIGSGEPGREIEGPMAVVILGGLLTSTALNLLVLPTLSLRFGRFDKAELAEE
ncbi:MAG TPA: efflux RND transporter permease subunit [Bryobacteraceae bacterium]|nr:efflux RND transporter permease subunit [Bryobacteraceae bacterium]